MFLCNFVKITKTFTPRDWKNIDDILENVATSLKTIHELEPLGLLTTVYFACCTLLRVNPLLNYALLVTEGLKLAISVVKSGLFLKRFTIRLVMVI